MAQYESTMMRANGEEVRVFADEFEGDESVGIAYGPTCIWAEDFDGNEVKLTPQEEAEVSFNATERAFDDDDVL